MVSVPNGESEDPIVQKCKTVLNPIPHHKFSNLSEYRASGLSVGHTHKKKCFSVH